MSQFITFASSFLGVRQSKRVLNKNANTGLVISIVSAFFIVLVASLVLNAAVERSVAAEVAPLPTKFEEKSAYIPGQFIAQEINKGYIGVAP